METWYGTRICTITQNSVYYMQEFFDMWCNVTGRNYVNIDKSKYNVVCRETVKTMASCA